MEESRTQRLQFLLRKLAKAVHASVLHDDEVRSCLEELRHDGWEAVMLLEAGPVDQDPDLEGETATLRFQVAGEETPVQPYRIDAEDVRLLGSLGIAPGRHRSRNVGGPFRDHDPENDPT